MIGVKMALQRLACRGVLCVSCASFCCRPNFPKIFTPLLSPSFLNRRQLKPDKLKEELGGMLYEDAAVAEIPQTVLKRGGDEQAARLNTAPLFRREFDSLVAAINRRLTPADRTALKAADAGRLSANIGLSRDQAQALARVHAQTQAVNGQLHLHRQ